VDYSEGAGRDGGMSRPQLGSVYQRWEGWIVPTLSFVAMT
jgi:hypothetical protein